MTAGGRAGGAGWLDVRASAAVAGRFVALEQALWRRLGELATAAAASDAALSAFLSAASMAHAWRSSLFEPLLPVSVGLPEPDELVVLPPADQERIEELDGGPATLDALLREVYPALLEEYVAIAAGVARVSDGPLALAAMRAGHDLRRIVNEAAGQRTTRSRVPAQSTDLTS